MTAGTPLGESETYPMHLIEQFEASHPGLTIVRLSTLAPGGWLPDSGIVVISSLVAGEDLQAVLSALDSAIASTPTAFAR
jgi:hypothetical protein